MIRTLPLFDGHELDGNEFDGKELDGNEFKSNEFEGIEPPRMPPSGHALDASAPSAAPCGAARAPRGGGRHLRAAWRLSRGMWRYPERSPEQTKAGLAICRHLQALLAEADEGGRRA